MPTAADTVVTPGSQPTLANPGDVLPAVLVPSVTSSALWCSPAEAGECRARAGCDVLELGARLLGDVHGVRLLLHCLADHASFFLLTEDSWLSYSLDVSVRREPVLYCCNTRAS